MRSNRWMMVALSALAWPAAAQEKAPAPAVEVEAPATQPASQPASPPPSAPGEDEGPIPEPKVPEDPLASMPRESEVRTPAMRYDKRDYPIELVKRPLTLAADQGEISLDVPLVANDGHPTLTQVLRGAFGVTVDLQLGLTYSVGVERLKASAGQDDFVAGKAFSADAAYTIIPGYLAAQLRLAFFVDPDLFAMGAIVGLPFKIEIGDQWAIFGGGDLVHVRIKGFAVDAADPAINEKNFQEVHVRGVQAPRGGVNVTAGAMFQARPDVAVYGSVGLGWPDIEDNRQAFALFAGVTYSPGREIDIGGRVGFYDLGDPAVSFSAAVYAGVRF